MAAVSDRLSRAIPFKTRSSHLIATLLISAEN